MLSRETLLLYFRAEIILLSVIPSAVVASECWVLLKVFGDFVKTRTLNTTHSCIGDKKFIFMLVDQVSVDFAREFRVFWSGWKLTRRDCAFYSLKVIPWKGKEAKTNVSWKLCSVWRRIQTNCFTYWYYCAELCNPARCLATEGCRCKLLVHGASKFRCSCRRTCTLSPKCQPCRISLWRRRFAECTDRNFSQ